MLTGGKNVIPHAVRDVADAAAAFSARIGPDRHFDSQEKVEEALAEVDRFLDHAMLSNQNTVYIIHGNGTGALRNAIQKHLRTHRGVKSFRLGRYGEGESGVTVVELK